MIRSNYRCDRCGGRWLPKPGGLEPRECPWCENRSLRAVIAGLFSYVQFTQHAANGDADGLTDGVLVCPSCQCLGDHLDTCAYSQVLAVAEQIAMQMAEERREGE